MKAFEITFKLGTPKQSITVAAMTKAEATSAAIALKLMDKWDLYDVESVVEVQQPQAQPEQE